MSSVVSGQDVFTEDHEKPTETFGVVVEDENGAAQSLNLDSARAQLALEAHVALEFPKVCVVLGKESRPAANFLLQCGASCVICVCSGGGAPITPQNSRYVTCTIVSELIKMSEDDTVRFLTALAAQRLRCHRVDQVQCCVERAIELTLNQLSDTSDDEVLFRDALRDMIEVLVDDQV